MDAFKHFIVFSSLLFATLGFAQPADWEDFQVESVYESASLKGRLEEDFVRFHLEIQVRTFKDKWVALPFFPSFCSVLQTKVVEGEKEWVYLYRDREGYQLFLGKPGLYRLQIEFVTRIHKKSEKAFSLQIPQWSATHSVVELTIPHSDVSLTVTPALTKSITRQGNETTLTLYGEGSTPLTLDYSLEAQPEELKPIINANQFSFYYVDRQILKVRSEVEFSLLQGTVDLQKFEIPKTLTLLNLSGTEVKTWYMKEEGDRKILVVNFNRKLEKSFLLQLDLEQVLPQIPSTFSIPSIAPLEVERESGFIGITAKKGLRAEALEIKELSKIDPKELPELLKQREIHLGFKYLNRPFELKVSAQEVIPKVESQINTKISVQKDSLKTYTYIDFNVKDAGVFQFKLELSDGLKPVGSAEGFRASAQGWVPEAINIQDPIVTETNSTLLLIDLRSKVEGKFRIILKGVAKIQGENNLEMPAIRTLDVVEEVGYLGISSITDFKVDLASKNSVNQININDLPSELLQYTEPGIRENMFLAFRDNKLPYQVAINLSKIQPEVHAKVLTLVTVQEKEMLFSTEVLYEITKAGIFSVELKVPKLLLNQLNVLNNPQIDYSTPFLEEEKLVVTLKSKTEGTFKLQFTSEIPISEVEKGLAIPTIQTTEVKKEEGFIAVELKTSIRIKPGQKFPNVRDIDIQELPPTLQSKASKIAIAYRYFKHPIQLNLEVERIIPRVLSDTFHFLKVSQDLLDVQATLSYEILYAGVSKFRFELPKEAINVNVIESDSIKHKDNKENPSIWNINTFSERLGKFQVQLTFQMDLNSLKAKGTLPFHGVKVLDVERAHGYIAISANKEIELKKPEVMELTPLDEKELPPTQLQSIKTPILLAFRYLAEAYTMTLYFDRHEPAEVLVAAIEGMKLHSVINSQGKVDTRILLYLKNTKEQYLRLVLPEKAKIMPAYVNGEEVVPNEDSADPRTTLINIEQAKQEEAPLLIHLQYIEDLKDLGAFGRLNLVCPKVKIPVLRVAWTLNLPTNLRLLQDEGGTMERVYSFDPYLETPIFNFNSFIENARRQGVQHLPGPLTATGNQIRFQQLIPLDGESSIALTYTKENFKETLQGTLVVVLVLLLGLGIYLNLKASLLIIVAFSSALLFLALRTLYGYAYFEFMSTLVYGSASLGLCWSLFFLGKNYRQRIRQYREDLSASLQKRRDEALLRKYPPTEFFDLKNTPKKDPPASTTPSTDKFSTPPTDTPS